MKRVILMLAFCSALVTMPAQTKTKSESTKKEGISTEQGKRWGTTQWEMPQRYDPLRYDPLIYEDEMTDVTPTPLGMDKMSSNGTSGSWKLGKNLYAYTYMKNYRDGHSNQKVISVIVSNRTSRGKMLITASDISYKNRPVATVVYTKDTFSRGPVCKTWDVKNRVDGTSQTYAMCSLGRPAWMSNTKSKLRHAFYSDSY